VRLLLDTHVWFWSLTAPDRLAGKLRSRLQQAKGRIFLSPISVWELLVLAERGRVRLDAEPRVWVRGALARAPLEEAVLNHEVAIRSREVALPHQDPADRFLVATALVYDLTLVTADDALLRAKACPTLANR
jgi:PIN domain nuclease of toxin-antitoxin system